MRDAGLEEAIRDAGGAGALARKMGTAPAGAMDEIDIARAQEYALLSTLLARAPDGSLLSRVAGLRGAPRPLGLARAALAEAADRTTAERVEREYFDLFIGIGRGELLPYGSYYM